MKKLRDILVLLSVVIGFGVSLFLFRRVVGVTSPGYALIVMFSFLGCVAFARPLFLLRVPGGLRSVRGWEIQGKVYRAMGVPPFGVMLRRTPLRYLHPLVYLSKYPTDPAIVQNQIEGAEAAHFWAAALLIPYMVYVCVQRWWSVLFWLLLVQVIGNLYPILHLRLARGRLKRVFDKKSALRVQPTA